MQTGISELLDRVETLTRLTRDRTKRAFRVAEEARRLGAQLEDAVAELRQELKPDTKEDTDGNRGENAFDAGAPEEAHDAGRARTLA